MALDKNRILSELGSVVNQLQSADCGCMGKLFNQGGGGGMGGNMGGCRGGCCHGGYNYCAGDPMAQQRMTHGNMGHCMGSCNPPKLYSDTYGYLNEKLMKPTIKEVYEDLKSLSPANTIPNHPLAAQMLAGRGPAGGGVESQQYNMNMGAGGMNSSPMQGNPQQMGAVGGMGPDILNMMSSLSGKPAQQSPGQVGMNSQHNPGQDGAMGMSSMSPTAGFGQAAPPQMGSTGQNFTAQQMSQPMSASQPMSNNPMTGSSQQGMTNNAQQKYGLHAMGMAKFNEMFPGVVPKDLGFDPMAMAIQMDPNNRQSVTMNTMKEMMMGGSRNATCKAHQEPRPNLAMPNFTAGSAPSDPNQAPASQAVSQPIPPQVINQQVMSAQVANQLQYQTGASIPPPTGQQAPGNVSQPMTPQQVYATQSATPPAFTQSPDAPPVQNAAPTLMRPPGQLGLPQQVVYTTTGQPNYPPAGQQKQEIVHAPPILPVSTTKTNSHPGYILEQPEVMRTEISPLEHLNQQPPAADPLLPSNNTRYDYNTLGQSVQLLPAEMYRAPEARLPQTLSPGYPNVKNTMSKTSLMGNRPISRQTSRSQLQHIYHQYKGSKSYTQQNIVPSHGGTASTGRLDTTQYIPIERQGGDTLTPAAVPTGIPENDPANPEYPNANKSPAGDIPIPETHFLRNDGKKGRNGLQDQKYSAYPTSTAWSFHG